MPLIYFDTSHIGLLAKERAKGTAGYARFQKAFSDLECRLALSQTHIVEIRQHADSAIRLERYELIAALLPVDTDVLAGSGDGSEPITLEHREAAAALLAAGVLDASIVSAGLLEAFPKRLTSAADAQYLRSFESADFGVLVGKVRALMEVEVDIRARPKGQRYSSPRVTDLLDTPATAEQIADALVDLEHSLTDEALLRETFPDLTPEESKAAIEPYADKIRFMIARSGVIGPRNAYLEALGIQPSKGRDLRQLDRVTQDYVHLEILREVATRFGAGVDAAASDLLAKIPRSACPGLWLAREVELSMRSAEEVQAVSNAYDLEHVKYLPYVDLFFTDKRVADYIRRSLRSADCPTTIGGTQNYVSVPATVDAITDTLQTLKS